MKIKTSYLIYAVIGTVFAGLSMFTDIFEKGNFEAIFSNLGITIFLEKILKFCIKKKSQPKVSFSFILYLTNYLLNGSSTMMRGWNLRYCAKY